MPSQGLSKRQGAMLIVLIFRFLSYRCNRYLSFI